MHAKRTRYDKRNLRKSSVLCYQTTLSAYDQPIICTENATSTTHSRQHFAEDEELSTVKNRKTSYAENYETPIRCGVGRPNPIFPSKTCPGFHGCFKTRKINGCSTVRK